MAQTKEEVKKIAMGMIKELPKYMEALVDKSLNTGALNLDADLGGDMIWPKIIMIACLEREADQYRANGTSYGKRVNKEVKNLKLFI